MRTIRELLVGEEVLCWTRNGYAIRKVSDKLGSRWEIPLKNDPYRPSDLYVFIGRVISNNPDTKVIGLDVCKVNYGSLLPSGDQENLTLTAPYALFKRMRVFSTVPYEPPVNPNAYPSWFGYTFRYNPRRVLQEVRLF